MGLVTKLLIIIFFLFVLNIRTFDATKHWMVLKYLDIKIMVFCFVKLFSLI